MSAPLSVTPASDNCLMACTCNQHIPSANGSTQLQTGNASWLLLLLAQVADVMIHSRTPCTAT
jgi:hypothetical protein